MFHKEGGKIILIATTITVAITLLTPELISIFWLQKTRSYFAIDKWRTR